MNPNTSDMVMHNITINMSRECYLVSRQWEVSMSIYTHPVLDSLFSWSKGPNPDILYVIHMKPSGSRTIIQPNQKIEAFFTMMIENCDFFIIVNLQN